MTEQEEKEIAEVVSDKIRGVLSTQQIVGYVCLIDKLQQEINELLGIPKEKSNA